MRGTSATQDAIIRKRWAEKLKMRLSTKANGRPGGAAAAYAKNAGY
jgi:hypothetical protein